MDKKLSKTQSSSVQKKLEEERRKLITRIEELKKEDPFSDPDHASDNAAVDTDVREQNGHDTIEAEIKNLEVKLNAVDNALKKVYKGGYGFCERCKKQIPQARLDLIPEAHYCIDCERKLRK